MSLLKGWYWTKTLLACPPGCDTNIRYLHRGDDRVATFNVTMKVWPAVYDAKLDEICESLNWMERRGTT